MLACWSAKGGAGTTVVATALAAMAAAECGAALLVDLQGDVAGVCGLAADAPAEWPDGRQAVPLDAARRLEVGAGGGVQILRLASAHRPVPAERLTTLVAVLHADPRPVVVDVGTCGRGSPLLAVVDAATDDLLVTRACYLALRRAIDVGRPPRGIVLVVEPGRSLRDADVASTIGADVRATVDLDPAVARAVDAGTLLRRVPRTLRRSLGGLL